MTSLLPPGESEGVKITVIDDAGHTAKTVVNFIENSPHSQPNQTDPPTKKKKDVQSSENYQLFVNEVFQLRRQRTFIWTVVVLTLDFAKLITIVGCYAVLFSIHRKVIYGAWNIETLVLYLLGLFICMVCEIGFLMIQRNPLGFVNADCKVYTYVILIIIGCFLQFPQLIPFIFNESYENSYKFNNYGGQVLCKQYAHRTLKLTLRDENELCRAWAHEDWKYIKYTIAFSLCVNIVSLMCLTEYMCFARHYYNPGASALREYIEFRQILAARKRPPPPTQKASPAQTPSQPSSAGLTPTQSRILNRFDAIDPHTTPGRSYTHLRVNP